MMLSDDHLRHLVPMPPSPCGCVPRPWPRPVVPVPVTPQMQPHWAEELRRILNGKQDVIADLDEIREGAQAGAAAYQKPEDGVPKTDLSEGVQASLGKADTAVQPSDIAGFVDDAEYNAEYGTPPKPTILLKHGSEVVATVDATDFVIDGMVSNVEIEDGNLVITFNTDSGKQPISIPLTDIFNPNNYYDKTASDARFATKADATLTERSPTPWVCVPAEVEWYGEMQPVDTPYWDDDERAWYADAVAGGIQRLSTDQNATTLTYRSWGATVTATRTVLQGYTLGSQTTKPLASEAEAEALRDGKLDKSGGTMTGTLTIAGVDGGNTEIIKAFLGSTSSQKFVIGVNGGNFYIGQYGHNLWLPYTSGTLALLSQIGIPAFDSTATYAVGAKIVYGNAIWNCTTAVSTAGAWTGTTNWTKLFDLDTGAPASGGTKLITNGQVQSALVGKANDNAVVKLTGDQSIAGDKTFTGYVKIESDSGLGVEDQSVGAMVQFKQSGIEVYPADDSSYVLQYPAVAGTLALAAPSVAAAGNLAALDANGNPTDSGKKAGDFATAAQGTKADTAIQGVKVNGTALTPDANKAVNVQVPSAGSALPLIAGVSDAGSSANFSREDHVHPAETEVLPPGYALPASAFPVSAYGRSTSDPADIELFDATAGSGHVSWLNPSYGEVVAMRMTWQEETASALAAFNKSSGAFISGDSTLHFNGNPGVEGVSPVLTVRDSTVIVRGVEVASRVANATAGNLAALDANGNPTDSGVKPSAKLDSTSAAPAFSSDSSTQYAVGSHVTYNGKLYKCTTATTGGTWDASKWTADTMTDPDAVLDITAQNQLRVVAKDGTILWAQGYDLASTSSATLACDAVNNFTFADGATTQAFALPTAPTGKVGDFGLDIDNSANASAATMTLTGLDSTFSVVVPKGESLNDMLAIAAGELARFYVSLSTFRVNNLPTWHIVKQAVENGGAQS